MNTENKKYKGLTLQQVQILKAMELSKKISDYRVKIDKERKVK